MTRIRIIKQDNEGNVYVFPEAFVDRFTELVDQTIETEVGSAEWSQAVDELASEFGPFRA